MRGGGRLLYVWSHVGSEGAGVVAEDASCEELHDRRLRRRCCTNKLHAVALVLSVCVLSFILS